MSIIAELQAAVILAGKRIVKLNFGRRKDPVLTILRRVLRDLRRPLRSADGDERVARAHERPCRKRKALVRPRPPTT